MKKEMLINVLQPEECRIAILEDGILEELYVERTSHESYVGNIYKGRIVNIEPSIQAAFVDFGVGRNGFLHVSDVEPAYYRHLEHRSADNGGRRDRGGRDRQRRPSRPVEDDFDMLDPLSGRPAEEPEERAGDSLTDMYPEPQVKMKPALGEPSPPAPGEDQAERAREKGHGRRRSRGRSRHPQEEEGGDQRRPSRRHRDDSSGPGHSRPPDEHSPADEQHPRGDEPKTN